VERTDPLRASCCVSCFLMRRGHRRPTVGASIAAVNDLQTAETAALARTKGAVATRNEKHTALVTLLQQLKGYAQATTDANVENGASIIQGAGMAVRKTAGRAPRVFNAKPGTVTLALWV